MKVSSVHTGYDDRVYISENNDFFKNKLKMIRLLPYIFYDNNRLIFFEFEFIAFVFQVEVLVR